MSTANGGREAEDRVAALAHDDSPPADDWNEGFREGLKTAHAIIRDEHTNLGRLCAADLGETIAFQDGGASYRGVLNKVDHSSTSIAGRPMTMVVLVGRDDWRHIKSYPSETPCTVDVEVQATA